MNRRQFPASADPCALARSAAPERPNIVFLMADPFREDPTTVELVGKQL